MSCVGSGYGGNGAGVVPPVRPVRAKKCTIAIDPGSAIVVVVVVVVRK